VTERRKREGCGKEKETSTHFVTRIDQYVLGRTLGQGSMGKVKLAVDKCGLKVGDSRLLVIFLWILHC
jgi:serine/threonine protein kinase